VRLAAGICAPVHRTEGWPPESVWTNGKKESVSVQNLRIPISDAF